MPDDIHPREYADMQAVRDIARLALKIWTILLIAAVVMTLCALGYAFAIGDAQLLASAAFFGLFACALTGLAALRNVLKVKASERIEQAYRARDAAGKSDTMPRVAQVIGLGLVLFYMAWSFVGKPNLTHLQSDPHLMRDALLVGAGMLALLGLAAYFIFRRPAPEKADPSLSDGGLHGEAQAQRAKTRRNLMWIHGGCYGGIALMYVGMLFIGQ